MKHFLIILLTLLLISTYSFAQSASEDARKEIEKLNSEISASIKRKAYSDSLTAARRIVVLAETNFGSNHIETAKAFLTLGFVYFLSEELSEAEKSLQRSLNIYDSIKVSDNDPLFINLLETLASVKYKKDKYEEAENLLLRANDMRRKSEGSNTPKVMANTWSLANLNYTKGNFDKASELYKTVFKYRLDQPQANGREILDAYVRCSCSMYRANNDLEATRFEFEFAAEVLKKAKFKKEDIVNGKAKKLPRPEYPGVAAVYRMKGEVLVNIVIDEKGDVVFVCTKSFSGHPSFISAAERVAYKAKFEPTKVNGEPIKVIGTIIYEFVP